MFLVQTKLKNPAFSNSSGLKGVFQKFRFRDGLVWTLGLAVQLRLSRSVESSENLHGDVKHANLFE